MLQNEDVLRAVDKRLKKFISDVRFRPSDEAILLYVPREKVAEKVKLGFTSRRQLENLKKRLSKIFSKNVEVIYIVWDTHLELEDAFYQMLKHKFPDQVMSFYMSFKDKVTVNTWIEVSELTDNLKKNVEEYYLIILNESGLISGVILWIDSVNDLPSFPWLLRYLKTKQPINLENFVDAISGRFPSANQKWLSHKLDQLRKKELLIREKSGYYCLSAKGVSIVPAGAKYKSSDIDRALALGRRKW